MELSSEEASWVHHKLRGAPPPRFFSEDQFISLAKSIQKYSFPPGRMLIRQGFHGETCYLIHSGSVSVWAETPSQRIKLAQLKEGEFFGEVSVLTGDARNATVVAEEEVELFAIPASTLLEMIRKSFVVSENLTRTVARRHSVGAFGLKPTDCIASPASPNTLFGHLRAFFKKIL